MLQLAVDADLGQGGIFSKLRRGRSKMSFKEDDDTASRPSDAGQSLAPSSPNGKPSLALPLSFTNASQTNLHDDTGISQFLSLHSSVAVPEPSHEPPAHATVSKQPPQEERAEPDEAEKHADRGVDSAAERSWQSRVVIEMKEKEQLIGRFEALSRVHMALQEEVEKERARADRAEAAVKKKDSAFGRKPEPSNVPISSNGPTAESAGAGALAGSVAITEHDAKMAREREQLQEQQRQIQREQEAAKQIKADLDRERTILQTQKSDIERQKETQTTLVAEREREKSDQAAAQSDQAKDRELHTTQITDMNSRLSAAQASLNGSAAEIERLKGRNQQLQASVEKGSQGPMQVTDAEFADLMHGLAADVQSWVTNNFLKSKIDFEKLEKQGESKELKQIRQAVPQYKQAADRAKLPFLQALVSARLMDAVWDDDFYVALPDWEEEHETKEETARGGLSYLREAYKVLSASSTDEFHAWRAATVSLLRRTHDPTLTALTNKLISRTAFSINNMLSSITAPSGGVGGASAQGSSPLPSRVRDLQAFIAKAIDIARQFRTQRAVFLFSLPGNVASTDGLTRSLHFDTVTMEDAVQKDGLSESENEDKTVLAAAWPLVVKVGGEGAAKHDRSVVSKARVVCNSAH
ncbi:MAG: hypothetical protein Q9159_004059 [Coniocarpon cinnabarinum]